MIENPLENVFHNLYGQPCWNARSGYGSFLIMEFGQPSLEIREPWIPKPTSSPAVVRSASRRLVTIRGQWHLWISSCAWQVFTGDKRIGHSNRRGSTKEPIKRAAKELNGQKLLRVSFDQKSGKTIFAFDLGSRLETHPYNKMEEQWLLFEPSGSVFVLRGDGQYAYQPDNTPPDAQVWKPLLSGPTP